MDQKNLIIGLWKFKDTVKEEEILNTANEWALDKNYLQLYIRRVSKDQTGIGFIYRHNGLENAVNEYFDLTTDFLKRKYGNNYIGWDISSSYTLVKGF